MLLVAQFPVCHNLPRISPSRGCEGKMPVNVKYSGLSSVEKEPLTGRGITCTHGELLSWRY